MSTRRRRLAAPSLECLEDRTCPALLRGDQRRAEAVLRRAQSLVAPLPAPPALVLPAPPRGTSGAGGGRAGGLPAPPSARAVPLAESPIQAAFMLYDPRIQSAFSAVTLNHLTDRWAEIEGRGARFRETGRFVTLARRVPAEARRPCPDGARVEDFDAGEAGEAGEAREASGAD